MYSYRFRLIQMACDANFVFSIDSHDMTIIETDGENTAPLTVDSMQVYAAQRYSFIVCLYSLREYGLEACIIAICGLVLTMPLHYLSSTLLNQLTTTGSGPSLTPRYLLASLSFAMRVHQMRILRLNKLHRPTLSVRVIYTPLVTLHRYVCVVLCS